MPNVYEVSGGFYKSGICGGAFSHTILANDAQDAIAKVKSALQERHKTLLESYEVREVKFISSLTFMGDYACTPPKS